MDREEERYLTCFLSNETSGVPRPLSRAPSGTFFSRPQAIGDSRRDGRYGSYLPLFWRFRSFYIQAILVPEPKECGIHCFWPDAKERVADYNVQKEPVRIEVSDFKELRILFWGLYFSML